MPDNPPPNSEFGLVKLNSRCPSRDGASRSFEQGCSMSQKPTRLSRATARALTFSLPCPSHVSVPFFVASFGLRNRFSDGASPKHIIQAVVQKCSADQSHKKGFREKLEYESETQNLQALPRQFSLRPRLHRLSCSLGNNTRSQFLRLCFLSGASTRRASTDFSARLAGFARCCAACRCSPGKRILTLDPFPPCHPLQPTHGML
jgi:hypothetical protein